MKKHEFPSSEDAAEAAEFASSQGESPEMRDVRFESEVAFHRLQLARYAKELGLSQRQLRRGADALLRALQAE